MKTTILHDIRNTYIWKIGNRVQSLDGPYNYFHIVSQDQHKMGKSAKLHKRVVSYIL